MKIEFPGSRIVRVTRITTELLKTEASFLSLHLLDRRQGCATFCWSGQGGTRYRLFSACCVEG
jgi:hypothetical protein